MKTKQTKIDRSAAKWLPGAMALAATTASSQAASVVQITLTGNKISSTGNQLVADLTGDRNADVAFSDSWTDTNSAGVKVNGQWVWASMVNLVGGGVEFLVDPIFAAGVGDAGGSGPGPLSAAYLNPITFTDTRINGGITTAAWLQVNAFNTSATSHTVELARLIFDTESTTRPVFGSVPGGQTEWQVSAVPEPGSNLALLALGAGGLTLRRRLKRTA
jgi:hypothetical protein